MRSTGKEPFGPPQDYTKMLRNQAYIEAPAKQKASHGDSPKRSRFRNGLIIAAGVFLVCALASAQDPQQVNVSAKIIEFQTNKYLDTGFSAYFKERAEQRWGQVRPGNAAISAADFTFPKSDSLGITVFLDRLSGHYGDIELVLQALVDQGRAFVLSRPKAMVMVGADKKPTVIETVEETPYEETKIFGATASQITVFRPTGVMLSVNALAVYDEDGNLDTTGDTYINLVIHAKVDEEGSRVPVALDNRVNSETGNFISVPQFNSRMIKTTVWVRHGQVLILGGLFLNRKAKDLKSAPWLSQGEDLVSGTIQRLTPFAAPEIPLTAGLGKNRSEHQRRELVFLLKADLWRPSYTLANELGFLEEGEIEEESAERKKPTDVIKGMLEDITGVPQGLVEGIAGDIPEPSVTGSLGGDDQ